MWKNVASQYWTVFAFDYSTGAPKTGDAAQISATINLDNAGPGATNDVNPTELTSGYYRFTLLDSETNADEVRLIPSSSTGNVAVVPCPAIIYPVAKAASGIQSVALGNVAHGGAAATLTLLSGVINNTGGVGLSVTGSTTAVGIHGATIGLDLDASAGPAADIDGTTYGLDISASAGDGVQIVGTVADIDSDITGTITAVTTLSTWGGEVDVVKIHGSALTETSAGYIAGAFTKFFDIQTPAGTVNLIAASGNWNVGKTGYSLTSQNWAVAGDQMDLVNAPNATAVASIKTNLGTIPASGNWNVGKTGYTLTAQDWAKVSDLGVVQTGDNFVKVNANLDAKISVVASDAAGAEAAAVAAALDAGITRTLTQNGLGFTFGALSTTATKYADDGSTPLYTCTLTNNAGTKWLITDFGPINQTPWTLVP